MLTEKEAMEYQKYLLVMGAFDLQPRPAKDWPVKYRRMERRRLRRLRLS